MQSTQSRRSFLATLSSATAAGLFGGSKALAEESPLETTRIRLYDWTGLCIAPQFVAEELLKGEGFTDVQYLREESSGSLPNPLLASGAIDINSQFSAPTIIRVEAGDPVVFLGGLHVGCFELFGTDQIRSVRDLKGKRVAIPALGSPSHVFLSSIAAYVGLDPSRDINFVTYPADQSMQLLAGGKIDAIQQAFSDAGISAEFSRQAGCGGNQWKDAAGISIGSAPGQYRSPRHQFTHLRPAPGVRGVHVLRSFVPHQSAL
jgi:NitT/TauT family transport system substrate-binding protein